MIRCKVIREFTLSRFDELKNIQRKKIDTKGRLYVGDTFECNEDMAKYLMGDNPTSDVVIKIIEIIPKEEKETKPKKKKNK